MAKLRSSLALVLALSGCAGLVPPSATPDPALAEKVRGLMGDDVCSDRVAGALAAYHLTAGGVSRIDLSPVPPRRQDDYNLSSQRQAWVRQPSRPGAIVVQYDRGNCRVAQVYARDGATLPAV
ncbi:hypothetical protein KXS07_15305 [Inquilinus limosus]|uniref:hypothetical protein n=1 Tax=Inquilinus limosus TaxID=171674 RepID=UPI003F13589F